MPRSLSTTSRVGNLRSTIYKVSRTKVQLIAKNVIIDIYYLQFFRPYCSFLLRWPFGKFCDTFQLFLRQNRAQWHFRPCNRNFLYRCIKSRDIRSGAWHVTYYVYAQDLPVNKSFDLRFKLLLVASQADVAHVKAYVVFNHLNHRSLTEQTGSEMHWSIRIKFFLFYCQFLLARTVPVYLFNIELCLLF